MTIEEFSPEVFSLEQYNQAGLWHLDDALYAAISFGCCDASRLLVRPKAGEYALMVTWGNGSRYWFHVTSRMLQQIRKRLARRVK